MQQQLSWADGVMIGREAYHNPGLLLDVDHAFYGREQAMLDRKDVIRAMYPYIEAHLAQDGKLAYITRHLLGLFNGLPGARQFRRHLSEQAYKKTATLATIEDALALMPDNADELNAIADTASE